MPKPKQVPNSSPFPTIVYRSGGPHAGPPGHTYSSLGVDGAPALEAVLEDGWQPSLAKACGIEKPDPKPSEERARAKAAAPKPLEKPDPKLLERAKAAGVEVDGRWGADRVLAEVEKAEKAKA